MEQKNNQEFYDHIAENQEVFGYNEEVVEESDFNDIVEDEKSKKSKGMLDREKFKQIDGPLKKFKKENKKRIKDGKPKMIFAGITVSIMIICLFVYSIAYFLSPTFSIEAKINVVKGGYSLEYVMCELPISHFTSDVKIGKSYYISQDGYQVESPREGMQMTVVEIIDNVVKLEFDINDVPTFIDTHTFKTVMQTETPNGKYISNIYLNGKVIAGRFILHRITLDQKIQ